MKRLPILKVLAHILFILSIIAMFFAVPFIFVMAVMPGRIPFEIDNQPAAAYGAETIIYLLASTVGFAFDIYALYLFKKLLRLFERNVIFHPDVIRLLDQIGKAILIGYAICFAADFLYAALVENRMEIDFIDGIDTAIATIGLGVFFLVLSDVFLMAKNIKDENDLTV